MVFVAILMNRQIYVRFMNSRPLVCRVEEYYLQHLTQHYSWQEFVRINLEVCQRFQSECDVD